MKMLEMKIFLLLIIVENCEKKLKQFQAAYYKEKLLKSQKASKITNASFSVVKKRKIDPIESAMNNIQATIHNVVSAVNNAESSVPEIPEIPDNVDALVGKLIAVRLNQMSPITAKKKRQLIMQCLIDQDSDSDT